MSKVEFTKGSFIVVYAAKYRTTCADVQIAANSFEAACQTLRKFPGRRIVQAYPIDAAGYSTQAA